MNILHITGVMICLQITVAMKLFLRFYKEFSFTDLFKMKDISVFVLLTNQMYQ